MTQWKRINRPAALAAVCAALLGAYALWPTHDDHGAAGHHDSHGHGHDHGGEGEAGESGHGETATICDEAAEAAGIETREAGPAPVRDRVTLTGRITLNRDATAMVKARFPGIVRSVAGGLGQTVAAGEVLATVESNDSLLAYPVRSPIAGVILERRTNVGDVAGEGPLFTVADLRQVWVEFFIFPRDVARIRGGLPVRIRDMEGGAEAAAELSSLLPVAEAASQTVVARATLDNPEGYWRAGMTVYGDVTVAEREAPVAVATAAVQREDGAPVVFVREGETYRLRRVTLGVQDEEWTEITAGLAAGERYVARNSFAVKAELGKAAAEHGH